MNDDKMNNEVLLGKSLEETWKDVNSIIVGIFVVLIFAVFPLVYHNYYYDILVVKYQFYYISVIVLVVLVIITSIYFLYKDVKEYQGKNVKRIAGRVKWRTLRLVDWAMIAFVATATISTFQSDFFYESFWGNEGRYCGLFLILLYGISFLIVTRFFRFRQWYLDLFLAAGSIACIIGILHYLKIDPLGFKLGLSDGDYKIFASTFGNINTYTSYLALLAGLSVTLLAIEKHKVRKIFYLITTAISLLGLITGISDNAYLALMALFGLLPLYLFANVNGLKYYVLTLAILSTEFRVVGWINQAIPNHVIGINGLFDFIAGFKGLNLIIAFLWGFTIILFILDVKITEVKTPLKKNNVGRWIWLGFLVGVMMIGLFVLYDVNVLGNVNRYGALKSYLLFNDEWGTHRGYVWGLALRIFNNFPLHNKLFGNGPDTFGIITVSKYMSEMFSKYYEKYDSAHNEYIQYLVTIGIAGLISYVTLLVSSILQIIRNAKKNPAIMAIVFSCLCYIFQATVNISVPIVAPIMMTLLMVGTAKESIG